MKRPPSFVQAGDYSATTAYLNAVKAVGTTDGTKVMEYLKSNPINDMYVKNGKIREDGRLMRPMYLIVRSEDSARIHQPVGSVQDAERDSGRGGLHACSQSKCSLLKKS